MLRLRLPDLLQLLADRMLDIEGDSGLAHDLGEVELILELKPSLRASARKVSHCEWPYRPLLRTAPTEDGQTRNTRIPSRLGGAQMALPPFPPAGRVVRVATLRVSRAISATASCTGSAAARCRRGGCRDSATLRA